MTAWACPCAFDPWSTDGALFSAVWHAAHREHHLAGFPEVDATTRRNLAQFVLDAERKESEKVS